MFKITKEEFAGRFSQIVLILASLTLMYLGGIEFLIISLIFFASAGLFEHITMNYFHSKPKGKSAKDKNSSKIKSAFLWVHKNIDFIEKYNTTIYNFKKISPLVCALSYLIMFIYIALALFLYRQFSYWGFSVYLVPVITNTLSFSKHRYYIQSNKLQ